jgi:hypothetical protein
MFMCVCVCWRDIILHTHTHTHTHTHIHIGSWPGFEPKGTWTDAERDEELVRPTPNRIFALADAFYNAGYSVDRVHEMTKIDRWCAYCVPNVCVVC